MSYLNKNLNYWGLFCAFEYLGGVNNVNALKSKQRQRLN